jgi:hypothetical protein
MVLAAGPGGAVEIRPGHSDVERRFLPLAALRFPLHETSYEPVEAVIRGARAIARDRCPSRRAADLFRLGAPASRRRVGLQTK